MRSSSQPTPTVQPPPATPAANRAAAGPNSTDELPTATDHGSELVEIDDDGRSLWASPTAGEPISAVGLPLGTRGLLHLHPARMEASSEGRRIFRALGPDVAELCARWQSTTGLTFSQIETLTIAVLPSSGQGLQIVSQIELAEPIDPRLLWPGWRLVDQTAHLYGTETFHLLATLNADAKLRSLTIGDEPLLRETAALGGSAPPLPREFAQMLAATDAQRDLTALVSPALLFAEGRAFFFSGRPELSSSLESLWAGQIQTAMLSLDWGELGYWELRLAPTSDRRLSEFEQEWRARWARLPLAVSDYLAQRKLDPFWKKLTMRFPAMVRFMTDHSRIGTDDHQLLINGLLPPQALHNLILGAELATATELATPVTDPAQPESRRENQQANLPPTKPPAQMSLVDVLSHRTNFTVLQQSLEFAIRDFAEQIQAELAGLPFNFEIEIVGNDLQLEGITRNQQIRNFNAQQSSVSDILTEIVMKANPVTTVKRPDDSDQKLVWVVATANKLQITTRAGAANRHLALPQAFRTPGDQQSD
jgi:hypothetical protein